MKELTVGSRGSQLALWQAHWIRDRLSQVHADLPIHIQVIKTTGDRLSELDLQGAVDGKGLFVKEIEEALLSDRIDLAVHSLKDVPTVLPPGLTLATIPRRADPRDALVLRRGSGCWRDLPPGARVATSSLRRRVQLLALREDLSVEPVRGNVDTRLRKLEEQGMHGMILAAAGLKRLGWEDRISYVFPVEEMIPAVGQGALAVEIREGDTRVSSLLEPLHDSETAECVAAERVFLAAMGGGCQVPMGGHARLEDGTARFDAFLASPLGRRRIGQSLQGKRSELRELGLRSAEALLAQGARDLLEEFDNTTHPSNSPSGDETR